MFESQNVQELLDGCICCTIQDDLKETLNRLIEDHKNQPIDVLFIEGTGVANPAEIEELLNSPMYFNQFELRSMISLVDASKFLAYRSIFSSTGEVRKLLSEQISSATIILLNKIDIVAKKSLIKIEKKLIEDIGLGVQIFKTKYGEIPINELFSKRYAVHQSNTGYNEHHHHSTINTLKIDKLPVMHRFELENWLNSLPKTVLRGKGIIRLKEDPGLFNMQFSSDRLVLERMKGNQSTNPTLVLIGDHLNKNEILDHFSKLFN